MALLVILHAQVAWTGNQHDAYILQRAFDDVHELVEVAGWWLGGVGQEGIFKVNTQSLGEVVVPKRQTTLQESKHTYIHTIYYFLKYTSVLNIFLYLSGVLMV